MLRQISLLACHIFICSLVVPAKAAPADSPGTVYIDGLPCNIACQNYMTWSRRVAAQGSSQTTEQKVVSPKTRKHKKPAMKSEPASIAMRAGAKGQGKKTPRREASDAKVAARKAEQSTRNDKTNNEPAPAAAATIAMPSVDPRPRLETSKAPSDQAQALPAVQDLDATSLTSNGGNETKSIDTKSSDPETRTLGAAEPTSRESVQTSAVGPAKADQLIAIVLLREDIKSVAELANKTVAVDALEWISAAEIKEKIVQAGAIDVQISEDKKLALGRVMDGEVPAGVVSIVSPEEAARWTDLPGFNTIRIPFSHASGKSGPG